MNMIFTAILTILGLSVFEVVSSVDNAVMNAQVLATMGIRSRQWFLTWGLFVAVFIIRGLLPWAILWAVNPGLGPVGALTASFSGDSLTRVAIRDSAPYLLLAGGIFLIFLFCEWFLLEEKSSGLPPAEKFFTKNALRFYAVVSVILLFVSHRAFQADKMLALAAVVGASVFFITHGFKRSAEAGERALLSAKHTDLSKLLYLEIIDGIFSIDSVLGAFAFTLSVPVIILGSGLGALIVRRLTTGNIENIKKYRSLKDGAMYSMCILGIIMLLDAFGLAIPEFISPLVTICIIGIFFYRSHKELKSA